METLYRKVSKPYAYVYQADLMSEKTYWHVAGHTGEGPPPGWIRIDYTDTYEPVGTLASVGNKPKLFSFFEAGIISLSAYSYEDLPNWENNHIDVCELRGRQVNPHESVLDVLSNVLYQAGIELVRE